MHKKDKKMAKKVLYKHINNAVLQAAEDRGKKTEGGVNLWWTGGGDGLVDWGLKERRLHRLLRISTD